MCKRIAQFESNVIVTKHLLAGGTLLRCLAMVIVGVVSVDLSQAAGQVVDNTIISSVSVSGGADTANPGTTCIRITSPVSAACTGGFVAIPNNNKALIAAALLNKSTGSKVWLYYDDAVGSNHCPGQAFTPCSVISIESK